MALPGSPRCDSSRDDRRWGNERRLSLKERSVGDDGNGEAMMPKSRAERDRGRGETPSKRALRGAQKTARQDPERGVTSRARKRVEGREDVPDPKYGGRPGQEKSKWRPPGELMSPRQKRIAKEKR